MLLILPGNQLFGGPQGRHGYSVIETLVVIFIFGILAAGIIGLAVLGSRAAVENERRIVALALANEQVERIRSLPFEQVDYAPAGGIQQQQQLERNEQTYTLETLITADAANAVTKQIEITVSWEAPLSQQRNVQLVTYVTQVSTALPGNEVYTHTETQLFVVDVDNLAAGPQPIGFFGTDEIRDISVNSRGEMYGIRRNGTLTSMYAIDQVTGRATLLSEWDTGLNATVSGEFLTDDIFVIGGTDVVIHYDIQTKTVVREVTLTTTPETTLHVSGDMVQLPNGLFWAVGSHDALAEYCWQIDPQTGVAQQVGGSSLGTTSFPMVLGVACNDAACTSVSGFSENGDVHTIDTAQCRILSTVHFNERWTGAGR